jgi:hypothetical protein
MKLSSEQIDFIQHDIYEKGVELDDLADSLVDHICCYIEQHSHSDFNEAYQAALNEFGRFGPKEIQENTLFLLTLKTATTMKITMYLFGYFSAILVTTGILFKVMHWPPASILLVLGIALLNFGYLPMYFYSKYKQSVAE